MTTTLKHYKVVQSDEMFVFLYIGESSDPSYNSRWLSKDSIVTTVGEPFQESDHGSRYWIRVIYNDIVGFLYDFPGFLKRNYVKALTETA